MAFFYVIPAAVTYYSAAAVGAAVAGALGITALSTGVITAIGAATISAGFTAVRGGSASDILKSALYTGVTAGIGSSISASVASDVAFDAIANSSISGGTAVAIGNTLGEAAKGALASGTSALLQGKDPIEALLRGGLTAGLSAGVGETINALTKDIPFLSQPTGSIIGDAVQRAAKAAVATSIIGGAGAESFEKSLLDSFAKVGVSYIGDTLKDNSANLKFKADRVKSVENAILVNTSQQEDIIKRYNFNVESLQSKYDKLEPLKNTYEAALAKYESMGDSADWQTIENVNTAATNYTEDVKSYNYWHGETNKWLDSFKSQLKDLQDNIPHLVKLRDGRAQELESTLKDFQSEEAKNAEIALKALNDIAVAKEIYKEDTGREITDDELKQLAKPGADLISAVDKSYTSEAEAKEMWKEKFKEEPTEFDLLELIGIGEDNATSKLSDVKAGRETFTTSELKDAYKAQYGKEPTESWMASDEAKSMLMKTDAAARATLGDYYKQDKNTVTKDEAIEFLKKAGLEESDVTQEQLQSALKGSEPGVETFFQTLADRKETTFDGKEYKSQNEAQAEAIKAGYNSYTWGDKDYTVMSPEQVKQLQADRDSGKNVGVSPDQIFIPVPGKTIEQQLADAGNPDEYAYEQGDTIVVVSKKLAVPDYNDTEAWNAFKTEKEALGGDTFQSYLTEQFSILEQAMKGAPKDSVANVMANAAMFGYGKMAQLAETFSRTGEAMGIPQAERGTNIAKQVQSWSNKLVDQGIQNAEAAVLANVAAVTKESIAAERGVRPSDISTAELYAQKTAALFKQVPNNPLGVSLFLTGEAIQEIPLLVASGGVGSVFANVIGKSVGLAAAVGTNVALNGAESFGGNYGEVKEYLRKQGVPEAQIEALAVKSGLEAMAVGMMTSYVGDRALIKSFMGDLATDSFTKTVASNSAREWFMGNFEGSLQNMSAQIGKYGSIKSEDEWLNAGIMEGFAQKGIAAGVLTADALSRPVAKDYDGKPVTYKEVIEGTKTFDPKTLDKEFSFGNGVNLGDALGYHSTFLTNPDITPDEYFYAAQTFRDNGMNDFTPQEIASLVGTPGELSQQQIAEVATPYAQGKVVTPQEAQQMAGDLGYTNLSDSEAVALAGQISEADAQARVSQFVDPRQVTRQEAESFFGSIPGYAPTEADIAAFVRQGSDVSQEAVKSEVGAYVDPRMVDEGEARAAYEAIGLKKPTQSDIQKMLGQYAESDLAGKATENLDAARYNSLLEQIEQLGTQAGVDPAVLEAIKNDINSQITSLGGDVTKLQSGLDSVVSGQAAAATKLSDLQKSLSDEIQAAKDIGLQGDAALEAGLSSLADKVGVNQADLLAQLGTTAGDLRTQFAADIAASQTATTQEIANTKSALEAAIADAKASGLQGDAALQAGIDSVAAQLGTTKEALLSQLGTTEAGLRQEFASGLAGVQTQMQQQYNALTAAQKAEADARLAQGQTLEQAIAAAQAATTGQISGLEAQTRAQYESLTASQKAAADALVAQGQTLQNAITAAKTEAAGQIAGVETRLTDAIAAAEAMGLSRDQAITAAVDSVASELGTTRAALLAQLGTTEAGLRQEFASGISGLEAQTKAQYDSLSAAQKATADALVAQGQSMQQAITAAQQQTTGQIAGVESRLTDAIAAAEAMGLSRDQAITAAVDSVASELGITRNNLLTQLGTTEAALRTEFGAGLAGVSAEVKAAYDSLSADQKALANQLTQQGVDMSSAIQQAQQQTQGQIGALSADMQAKYDALTAEQKALATNMAQQGMDFTAAINLAQQQTQAQITGLGASVDARIQELMAQGATYQAATQKAIGELGAQNVQLAGQIGTQGRPAAQTDIDAVSQMLAGTRPVDTTYDVTGDKQITQADIDFLTQVVGGVKTDWTAPVGSVYGPTGLYGQLATSEAQRQADLVASSQREAEAERARVAREAAAEAARVEAARRGQISGKLAQGQQTLQSISQQIPQALQQATTTSTPIYGEMGPYLELGTPLDVGFFQQSPEKLAATKQQQTTRIAAGGYIDDLLAGDMTVDDLLNLLR